MCKYEGEKVEKPKVKVDNPKAQKETLPNKQPLAKSNKGADWKRPVLRPQPKSELFVTVDLSHHHQQTSNCYPDLLDRHKDDSIVKIQNGHAPKANGSIPILSH